MATEKEIPETTVYVSDEVEAGGRWVQFLSAINWYPKDMPTEEKVLVVKLDLQILIFGCLSFFTKYLDQSAITNAYVSGMKEDLDLYGNQLNYATIVFWASYCVFMIPTCYYLTRAPINIILPLMEAAWGFFTFGCAWAQNVETLYAMRFFVGIFECASFTGIIYVIGSWYKPNEIGRRVAFFFIASPLGTMFSGYLQTAAYTNLNGTNGLTGWRWLFIVCTIITLPICILGFVVFPDVPHRKKPSFLSLEEFQLAGKRLEGITKPSNPKLSKELFSRILGKWHIYLFVLQWCLLDQNFQLASTPFSLYLKAKQAYYSVVQINTLPTAGSAVSVVVAIIAGAVADKTGNFWVPSLVATLPVIIGSVLLVVWDVGEGGRLAAFIISCTNGAMSPLTMGWATIVMADDAEERAIVTASMNAIGQAIAAWSQLMQFPAVEAPNFHKGFISIIFTAGFQLLNIVTIAFLVRRDNLKKRRAATQQYDE